MGRASPRAPLMARAMPNKYMNYNEALDYLYGRSSRGSKKGLDNMERLMLRLGSPERQLRAFHVAGTNGKGSTCAYIESALRTAGYTTGLYTSPHLERFNDRIRINGVPVSDSRLAEDTTRVAEAVEALRAEGVSPTFFETTTAVAFTLFCEERVDYCVIEVGLGGRLDSTNVITPMVACVASIGLDHMKTLGDTVEQIAAEKAGIFKPGVPAIISPQQESVRQVLAQAAEARGCPITDLSTADMQMIRDEPNGLSFSLRLGDSEWPNIVLKMPGAHQALNASTALAALCAARESGALKISDADILKGLAAAHWPGRLEWVPGEPAILMDGAHNGPAARRLMEYARRHLSSRKTVLLMAMLGDKPVEDVVRQIARVSELAVITFIPDTPRAMEPDKLAQLLEANGVSCQVEPDIAAALNTARRLAGEGGIVVVTGSLYLIGQVRDLLAVDDGSLR